MYGYGDIIGLILELADNGFKCKYRQARYEKLCRYVLPIRGMGWLTCAQGVQAIRSHQQCDSFLKQSFVWMTIRFTLLDHCI